MQYLLGLAPPEDLTSLEERIVTDKAFYDELSIAEDELIDQYLSGELSDSEKEHFENHFLLTPERQRKVRFGRAFNRFVGAEGVLPDEDLVREDVNEGTRDVPKPPPKPSRSWYTVFLPSQNPILAYSLAAALLLTIVAVGWFALNNRKTAGAGQVYAVALVPGVVTRSGDGEKTKQISIPAGIDTVRLQLELDQDEYPTYSAQVDNSEVGAIYSRRELKAESADKLRIVNLDVPAKLITVGDFQIKLRGVQANGSEEFLASYYLKVRSQ